MIKKVQKPTYKQFCLISVSSVGNKEVWDHARKKLEEHIERWNLREKCQMGFTK